MAIPQFPGCPMGSFSRSELEDHPEQKRFEKV
jgi:hypothetical protein